MVILIIMNSLNDNVIMKCNVRNSNIFEIISKIYLGALAFCSGEHFKWENINYIGVTIILGLIMIMFT